MGALSALTARLPARSSSVSRPAGRGVVDVQADETFEHSLTGAMLRSERLRLGIMAAILGLSFARWIAEWLVVLSGLGVETRPRASLWALTIVGGAAFAYELYALFVATRALRLGQRPSMFIRYRNAFIETTLPTLVLLIGAEAAGPSYLEVVPVAWFYFPFIILATLRLDFWLCAFTGLVAAVEYGALSVHYFVLNQADLFDPGLASPAWIALRVGILLGCGLLAGLISLQIRRQFTAALRSVQERNMVVSIFGQHVSPAVVDQLLSQPVESHSEVREVCVMFLDIQDFTTFAEQRSPAEVVAYLNSLFSVLIAVINRHSGIVNKFLGDGFLAIFGAPVADASASRNAVAAALAILDRVGAMNASGEIAATQVRIGLHAGEVVTGTVGSAERKEYTIIGDVVNLASRLEQLNKQFGSRLLVSESVVRQLGDQVGAAEPLGSVRVKGRTGEVGVYRLA
jgi:adenylate cyclase